MVASPFIALLLPPTERLQIYKVRHDEPFFLVVVVVVFYIHEAARRSVNTPR